MEAGNLLVVLATFLSPLRCVLCSVFGFWGVTGFGVGVFTGVGHSYHSAFGCLQPLKASSGTPLAAPLRLSSPFVQVRVPVCVVACVLQMIYTASCIDITVITVDIDKIGRAHV